MCEEGPESGVRSPWSCLRSSTPESDLPRLSAPIESIPTKSGIALSRPLVEGDHVRESAPSLRGTSQRDGLLLGGAREAQPNIVVSPWGSPRSGEGVTRAASAAPTVIGGSFPRRSPPPFLAARWRAVVVEDARPRQKKSPVENRPGISSATAVRSRNGDLARLAFGGLRDFDSQDAVFECGADRVDLDGFREGERP